MDIGHIVGLSISLVLEVWLFTLLFRQSAQRRFLLFFAFVVAEGLATAAQLIAISRYAIYFYVYWCTEAVLLPVSLAALHEVFHWVFEGLFRIWWFRLFYYGIIVAVLAIAVRNAFVSPPVQAHPVVSIILAVGVAINLVRMGIIGLFVALDRILGMEYERHAYGIVIGFGIASIGSLIGFLAFSGFGTKVILFATNAPAVGYILGLVIWVAAFIRPEPEEGAWQPPMPPEQMLAEVRGYLRALGIFRKKR